MFRFLKNRRRLFWLTVVAVPLILFSYGAWRWHTVAKLQQSLNRNYEIDFNDGGRPPAMPQFLDNWTRQYFERLDRKGELSRSRSVSALQERVRIIFRGSIRNIAIYFPEGIDEHLGPALENFPNLEIFYLEEPADESGKSERMVPPLIDSLGKLERLSYLQIFKAWFGLEEIREIASWQSLETLELEECRLPEGFIRELAKSPTLKRLMLFGIQIDRELTAAETLPDSKRDPFSVGSGDPFAGGGKDPRLWKPSPEELEILSRAGMTLEWK